MRNVAVLALVLGCNNATQHHTTVVVDGPGSGSASPDAPPNQSGSNTVKLDFFGTPDLIVYRDGAGPWVVPTAVTGGYTLHVTDDYEVVAACNFSALAGNEDSEQLNATFGDGAEQFMFCSSGGSGATFAVTGQMLQPGTVSMQATAKGTTAPWSFSLNVNAGTHELVAIGATQMLIRRNLALNAATVLPDVDVASAGTAYTPVTATVTGAIASDSIEIRSGLYTGNDFATLSDTTDSTIIFAPPALLVQNDQQQVEVQVENVAKTTIRSVFAFDATPTTFALPPELTGVTFGATPPIAATWGTLPAYDNANMVAFGGTAASFVQQNVTATKAWLTKTGSTSLAFAADATGYNPAWNVPAAGAYLEFSVSQNTQNPSTSTGAISGASALAHSKLRDQRRARHQH